jgi:hypothetical protein
MSPQLEDAVVFSAASAKALSTELDHSRSFTQCE